MSTDEISNKIKTMLYRNLKNGMQGNHQQSECFSFRFIVYKQPIRVINYSVIIFLN